MKRILAILSVFLLLFCFTSCKKEEIPRFNLWLYDKEFTDLSEKLKDNSDVNNQRLIEDFNNINLNELISTSVNEYTLSLNIFSKNIYPENVELLLSVAKEKDIPLIFCGQKISDDLLKSYDKAFCIIADYQYAGELFAGKILESWKDGTLSDRNKNKIFAFSSISEEDISPDLATFKSSFINYIEVLGIPLQVNDDTVLLPEQMQEYLSANKKENEAFIVIGQNNLSASAEYTPVGSGVEILTFYDGIENIYAETPFISLCFVDHNKYNEAALKIIKNISNHEYPFEEIGYPVNGKTVYITPSV